MGAVTAKSYPATIVRCRSAKRHFFTCKSLFVLLPCFRNAGTISFHDNVFCNVSGPYCYQCFQCGNQNRFISRSRKYRKWREMTRNHTLVHLDKERSCVWNLGQPAVHVLSCAGCSNGTHLGIVLDRGVRTVRNISHRHSGRQPIDAPADGHIRSNLLPLSSQWKNKLKEQIQEETLWWDEFPPKCGQSSSLIRNCGTDQ